MPSGKAGVACIPWARLDDAFLNEGIFEALGFSYSVASDETAIQIATQGCERMKAHYRLSDCDCEVVLVGDTVVVEIPEYLLLELGQSRTTPSHSKLGTDGAKILIR